MIVSLYQKEYSATVVSCVIMSCEIQVIKSEYVTGDVQVVSTKTQYELLGRMVETRSLITPTQCV